MSGEPGVFKVPLPSTTLVLREQMRIDVYSVPSRWQRFKDWVRFKVLRQTVPIPKPTPKCTITKVDYENRIVTFR